MKVKNKYGLYEKFNNALSFMYTKFFYKGARLVRRPVFIRGKHLIHFGDGFTTGYNCRIEAFETEKGKNKRIIFGENCKMGDYVHIAGGESVNIGNNVLMGSKILVTDISHGSYNGDALDSSPQIPPDERPINTSPVNIGSNVWVGDNVCILAGVNIGDGCVIGANSLVNKDIPNDSIAVGSPAKVVKKYSYEFEKWIKI